MTVVLLAGGTGGAKLAAGFQAVLPPGQLTVIANTADDEEFWGLHVSPDVDSVIYRLAGVLNDSTGWGRADETFNTLEEMRRRGDPSWFQIGDRDLATHLLRTAMLRRGCRLTETAQELSRCFGIKTHVLPMTDHRVRTRFITDEGTLSFQEYFVREHLKPALERIEFDGAGAPPSPEVVAALTSAELVVIGPSNPLISIAPILDVVRSRMDRARTVAVTPIVGGAALKGPTVEMMRALDMDPSPVRVAKEYADVASGFVLDSRDSRLSKEIERIGYRVVTCDTVMDDGGRRLAEEIVKTWS